jgi:hypothetical protein
MRSCKRICRCRLRRSAELGATAELLVLRHRDVHGGTGADLFRSQSAHLAEPTLTATLPRPEFTPVHIPTPGLASGTAGVNERLAGYPNERVCAPVTKLCPGSRSGSAFDCIGFAR